jgi:hypothetical protein
LFDIDRSLTLYIEIVNKKKEIQHFIRKTFNFERF